MIIRILEAAIQKRIFQGKAIILLGPRQCGKSTLVEAMLKKTHPDFLYLNGDEGDIPELLSHATSTKLKLLTGSKRIVFIDEAQRIPDIGMTLKLFTDQIKEVQVIATGSSSFELSNRPNEPLTGKKYEYLLYPMCFEEMVNHHGLLEEKRMLEQRLIFGYYPEIVTKTGEEKELLKLLTSSYLYKDLLMMEQIKKPVLISKLLKALALQVGSEVNYHELSQTVGADKGTVEKYIDLLEKTFIIYRLPAYNRNVRNEIKKNKKIYFYDCGIRNAIINNFQPLANRTDTGALWENFFITERLKHIQYHHKDTGLYFWRTTQQQEIDLIETDHNKMFIYACKRNENARVRFPETFTKNYAVEAKNVVTPANMEEFLIA